MAEIVKANWDREKCPRQYMEVPVEASVEDVTSVAGRFAVLRIDLERVNTILVIRSDMGEAIPLGDDN